jgi:hypothetical protein
MGGEITPPIRSFIGHSVIPDGLLSSRAHFRFTEPTKIQTYCQA